MTAAESVALIQAAQHDSGANRNGVATMLAWIDRPWALRELRPAQVGGSDPLQVVRAAERSLRGERLIERPADGPDGEWAAERWEWNDDRLLDASIDRLRPVLERITDLSDPLQG